MKQECNTYTVVIESKQEADMKKYVVTLISAVAMMGLSFATFAQSTVEEGVIKKAEVITTKAGKDGKPLLGAAVGVGIGSAFGSGSGNDAAKVVGGLIGAKRQAAKKQQTVYGWRYIVEVKGELKVVDAWCSAPNQQCTGVTEGNNVYVVNGNEVIVK